MNCPKCPDILGCDRLNKCLYERNSGPLAHFDAAIQVVTSDRGMKYGHPSDDFARVAHMAQGIEECRDPKIRHALYMILVKVSRLVQTPDHLDSVIDISGYARTIAMIIAREKETP